MKETKDIEYEEIDNLPYNTVEKMRQQLFETLEWKKTVACFFSLYLEMWGIRNIDSGNPWDIEEAMALLTSAICTNIPEGFKEKYTEQTMSEMMYFKSEFAKRNIKELDVSTIEWFSQFFDIFTTVVNQSYLRAKLRAKLLMWLPEDKLDELASLSVEDFLEKQEWDKDVSRIYCKELYDIFQEMWGENFWLWKAKEALKKQWEENPPLERIIGLAEWIFNEYKKEVFWVDLPEIHLVGVAYDETPEGELKRIMGNIALYNYILKNQLPS